MAKAKVLFGTIESIQGGILTLTNGDKVTANLNYKNQANDAVKYIETRSLKTVCYQAGATQWKESKATGHKFFKQV